jgi:hypothetical protein
VFLIQSVSQSVSQLEREREKEGGRERERDVVYGCFILILKGMMGALAPLRQSSYEIVIYFQKR